MDPHFSDITVGNIIGKPLVSTFVNQDKIEFESPARTRKVTSKVTVAKFIPISDRTLVLHSKIWYLHDFKTIFVKGIRPTPMFKSFQELWYLLQLLFCGSAALGSNVLTHLYRPAFTSKGLLDRRSSRVNS